MLLLVSSFAKNFVIFTRPVWEMYVICRRSLCQNGIKFYSNCILWILIGSGSSSCTDRSNVGIGRWTMRMFDKVLSIENRCYHQIVFLPQNKYRVYIIYGSEIIQASNRHACDLMHPKKAHCSRIEIIISSSIPIFFLYCTLGISTSLNIWVYIVQQHCIAQDPKSNNNKKKS